MEQSVKRIKWIDCAKEIAIIAVVVDHCHGTLYSNLFIAQSSYFSVSLFILLAGISLRISSLKKRKTFSSQVKRCWSLCLQYMLATAILFIFYTHFFDLKTYLSHLLNFSIAPPYYFFVFFFQLILIGPFLVSWCEFCGRQKYRYLWHLGTMLLICCLSSLFIRFTYILPVYGGGRYLFGGTYFILYYLGILFVDFKLFERTVKQKIIILCSLLIGWIVWGVLCFQDKLPFDLWLEPYYGVGINPPSIQLMIFAIITLFVLYSFYSLLEERAGFRKMVDAVAFLGRYTIYVFLYHLLIKDMIIEYFPFIRVNKWLMRICIFIPMITVPPILVWGIKKIKLTVFGEK